MLRETLAVLLERDCHLEFLSPVALPPCNWILSMNSSAPAETTLLSPTACESKGSA